MALLAPLSSGNFSSFVYNVIDKSSAAIYSTFSFANTGVSNYYYYRLAGYTASSTTFSVGTTNSITHLALRVNRWSQTVATFSICLIDSNSNVINGSSITYSALNSICAYPVDVINSTTEFYPSAWSWHAFQFSSPISLSTTASYAIRLSYPVVSGVGNATNVASFFSIDNTGTYSSGTLPNNNNLINLQKFFITSATQTAGPSDSIFIQGLFTGGTAYSPITMVMNTTASAPVINGVELSVGGSLIFATNSNTNYFLRLSGDLVINTGGYVAIGSSNLPMATSSNVNIEFVCPTASGAGLIMRGYSKFEAYGATLSYTKALLSANTSGTSVVTNVSTGWKSGDTIVFAPTGTSSIEFESATISTISGANITLVSPLTYQHSGSSAYIGEVANLSRNISIYALTYSSFISFDGGEFNFQNVRFDNFGTSNLGDNRNQPTIYTNTYLSAFGTSYTGNYRIPFGINYGTDVMTYKDSFTTFNPSNATSSILQSIGNTHVRNKIIQNCSFRRIGVFFSHGIYWATTITGNTIGIYPYTGIQQLSDIIIDNNIIYDIGRNYTISALSAPAAFFINSAANANGYKYTYYPKSLVTTSGTFSNNLFIGASIVDTTNGAANINFFLSDFNFINNTITGVSASYTYFSFGAASQANWVGNISGNIFHSNTILSDLPTNGETNTSGTLPVNTRQGLYFKLKFHDLANKSVSNNILWRNTYGINYGTSNDTTFTNILSYDNVIADSLFLNGPNNVKIINSTFSGTSSYGLYINPAEPSLYINVNLDNSWHSFYTSGANLVFDNCYFSNHSFSDIFISTTGSSPTIDTSINMNLKFNNCVMLSPLYFTGSSVINYETSVRFNNLNGGTFSVINQYGTITRDSSIYLSASYSTRVIPNTISVYNYTAKVKFGNKVIPYILGRRIVISVYVRKSGAGAETAYNGSEIRLILAQNYSIGVTDNTVLATTTSASNSGNWEKITGIISIPNLSNTMVEVYLDCDGTAGFVNIDDWSLNYIQ